MLKLNRVFYSTVVGETFSERIAPTPDHKRTLNEARVEIREHLRPLISKATVSVLKMDKQVSPKFRTQGSWRYGICLIPAWISQEMDLDYGVYLPVTVWEDNGPPHEMAPLYFHLVEEALQTLCTRKAGNSSPVRTPAFASRSRRGRISISRSMPRPRRNFRSFSRRPHEPMLCVARRPWTLPPANLRRRSGPSLIG